MPGRSVRSIVNPQESFHLLIGLVKDHVERKQPVLVDVAVPRKGVDGEDGISVVEEDLVLSFRIADRSPPRGEEGCFDLPRGCGRTMILRLSDGKGHLIVRPADHGGEPHVVAEDLVRRHPPLEIFQGCGREKLNGLPLAGFSPKIGDGMGEDLWDETEFRRNGDFDHPPAFFIEFDPVFRGHR